MDGVKFDLSGEWISSSLRPYCQEEAIKKPATAARPLLLSNIIIPQGSMTGEETCWLERQIVHI